MMTRAERKAAYLAQWREAQERWLRGHGFTDKGHGYWKHSYPILVEVGKDSCTARAAGASGSGATAKIALHYLLDLLKQWTRRSKEGADRVLSALHGEDQ